MLKERKKKITLEKLVRLVCYLILFIRQMHFFTKGASIKDVISTWLGIVKSEHVGHEGDGLGVCLQISVVKKIEKIFCSEICTKAKK